MFSNNKKQYVNILKHNKQLNLDYVILQDKKILKQEYSSFLLTDNSMPHDALFKLDTLQKNIPFTYIASIFEGDRQQVVLTKEVDVIGYDTIKLDSRYSVVVPKNEITSVSRYFANSGIDYLFSPFSVLNEYVQDNSVKNSLNLLVYNNIVYIMILNDLKQIVHCDVKALTPFEQVADKSFSTDEIVDQKLYEEVYFLEIQQFLNDVVQDYYTQNNEVEFLEQVKILYTLKPLSDEQINSLYETIMVDINYEQIDMREYLSLITQKEDILQYSFIDPRVKKQNKNTLVWFGLAVLSVLLVFGLIYTQVDSADLSTIQNKEEKAEVKKETQKQLQQPVVAKVIEFPNHILLNNRLSQNIYMLFDIVPYDAVLKDLEITQTGSTYVCMFVAKSESFEDMRIKLLNLYRSSKILLQHQNKSILNIVVENETLQSPLKPIGYKEYPEFEFLSIGRATDYINKLLIDQSKIRFQEKKEGEFLTYRFDITTLVKTPKEFFDFLDKINKQPVSIAVDFPVVFSSTNEGIEMKYTLMLHQNNKEQVELKK